MTPIPQDRDESVTGSLPHATGSRPDSHSRSDASVQLAHLEHMEAIEREVFPDSRPRSEVIVSLSPFAVRFIIELDEAKFRAYCEQMAAEIAEDDIEGYIGDAGVLRVREELLESWSGDLLAGQGLDRFDATVTVRP